MSTQVCQDPLYVKERNLNKRFARLRLKNGKEYAPWSLGNPFDVANQYASQTALPKTFSGRELVKNRLILQFISKVYSSRSKSIKRYKFKNGNQLNVYSRKMVIKLSDNKEISFGDKVFNPGFSYVDLELFMKQENSGLVELKKYLVDKISNAIRRLSKSVRPFAPSVRVLVLRTKNEDIAFVFDENYNILDLNVFSLNNFQ